VWAVAFACVIAFSSYMAIMGIGIASGPLVGGVLREHSWRAPFFGVSVLMLIALLATTPAGDARDQAAHLVGRPVPGASAPPRC